MVYIDPHDTYRRPGSKHNISRNDYLCDTLKYAKRGNELPHAKVNPDIVRKIRIQADAGITAKSQASEYGVHIRTIEAIRSYKTWQSVK
jgi:hypothetical protein